MHPKEKKRNYSNYPTHKNKIMYPIFTIVFFLALNPDYAIENLLQLETASKPDALLYFSVSP
jgi:hypothetical protein